MEEGLAHFGLEANAKKSYCWSIPRWKMIEEFGNFGDIFPIQPRVPYRSEYKYLGIKYKPQLRREVSWQASIDKAKRLERVIVKACKKVTSMPIMRLVQMAL